MKLEIGHHVAVKNLTKTQYNAFCQKAAEQGFNDYRYRILGNSYKDWKHIGIDEDGDLYNSDGYFTEEFPEKLLDIEQALSEEIEDLDEDFAFLGNPPTIAPKIVSAGKIFSLKVSSKSD